MSKAYDELSASVRAVPARAFGPRGAAYTQRDAIFFHLGVLDNTIFLLRYLELAESERSRLFEDVAQARRPLLDAMKDME